jgi:FtsZ-binding cell division protein ZapB
MASNNKPNQFGVYDSLIEKIREGDFRPKNNSEEEKKNQQKFERIQQNRYQGETIFHQKDEKTKIQIKNIQEELKSLVGSVKNLDKEIDKAIENIPMINTGIYHLNFLDKIRQTILLLKKNVDNASNWLETCNQKAGKKQNYWQHYKKSGAQWSLSSERNVATSVG